MRCVPSSRCLFLFAVLTLLLAGSKLFFRTDGLLFYLPVLLFAGIGILDLRLSVSLDKQIDITFPKVVRLSKNKDTLFCIHIETRLSSVKNLAVGLLLPEDRFKAPWRKQIKLNMPETELEWPVTGVKLGQYRLPACHIQINSTMGLWLLRTPRKTECEFRVYPNMVDEKRNLAAVFLGAKPGFHSQKKMGKGKEFEQLREYLPGDLYEDIHWKATAKRSTPVSKIYQIEKTQDVCVFIDTSRLSARHTAGFLNTRPKNDPPAENVLEKYITAALSVGLITQQQGDRFGLGVFNDTVEKFVPAGTGKSHFNACRDALYTIRSRRVSPDFTELIRFIGNTVRKRSLLIILTCLDDPAIAESLVKNIHILGRRHLVAVNMLNPISAAPVFSSPDITGVDDIYERLAGHFLWDFLKECEQSLRKAGIGFFTHTYEQLAIDIISHYLAIKKRQVL